MGQLYSHLVFRPPVPSYDVVDGRMSYVATNGAGEPQVHTAQVEWLRTATGSLIPAAWVRKSCCEHVVLFAHSNGDDLGNAMAEARRLSDALDLSVLAFDYTGYGLSELPPRHARVSSSRRPPTPTGLDAHRARATPSEMGCYADIDAAYAYLLASGIAPSRIVLIGRSIGSGPVVHLAARAAVAGVVLVAPIASAVRVALQRVRVTLPLIDTFANIDKVARIACPVLVVHGTRDELVPVRHAQLLVKRVRNAVEPLFVPTAAHNNVVEDNQSLVFGRCRGFLQELHSSAAELPRITPSHRVGAAILRFVLGLRTQKRPTRRRPRGAPPCTPARQSCDRAEWRRRRRCDNLCAPTLSVDRAAYAATTVTTKSDLDMFGDTDDTDSFVDALLRSSSVSMEFVSYPVDDSDRLSLSVKAGLGAYLRRHSKQQSRKALPHSYRVVNAC